MGHEFNIESNRHLKVVTYKFVPFFGSGAESLARVNDRYFSMRLANNKGVPSHVPLGVGEFRWQALAEKGHRMGFIVMASDMMNETLGMKERLRLFNEIRRRKSFSEAYFANFTSYCIAAAHTLKQMHEQGLVHTDPILRDFSFPIGGISRVNDMFNVKNVHYMSRECFHSYVLNYFIIFFLFLL
jgi:hypothetical protein